MFRLCRGHRPRLQMTRRLWRAQLLLSVHRSQTRTNVAVAIRDYESPDVADSNAIRSLVSPGARSQSVGTAAASEPATSSPPPQSHGRWIFPLIPLRLIPG